MGIAPRIGIITAYPRDDWHSQALVRAAARIGTAVVIRPESLNARLGATGMTVVSADTDLERLDGYVLARGFGERGNADFLVPVYRRLGAQAVMVNAIDGLLTAIDKFETSWRLHQAGIATPRGVVAQDAGQARRVLTEWGRAVAKPLFGSLGLGIELLTDTMSSRRRIPELLQSFGAVYLQEYVPNTGRDIRAFVVGVEVAASIVRVAAPGQWRTNVHQGGTPEMCELDATMRTMAVGAAQAVGLDYTGVDLMEGPNGPCVLEVNGNPLWRGVLAATGRNMAEDIVARVATLAESGKARGGTHSG